MVKGNEGREEGEGKGRKGLCWRRKRERELGSEGGDWEGKGEKGR